MNVYVESNFVLEHALEQEEYDSCAQIIRLAADRHLNLVIPAFSLAEPHQAIFSSAKTRSRLGEDLRIQLREIGRSRRHRELPAAFDALAAALIASARFEREGLRQAAGTVTPPARCAAAPHRWKNSHAGQRQVDAISPLSDNREQCGGAIESNGPPS